jgi:hypothetical protein
MMVNSSSHALSWILELRSDRNKIHKGMKCDARFEKSTFQSQSKQKKKNEKRETPLKICKYMVFIFKLHLSYAWNLIFVSKYAPLNVLISYCLTWIYYYFYLFMISLFSSIYKYFIRGSVKKFWVRKVSIIKLGNTDLQHLFTWARKRQDLALHCIVCRYL